MSDATFATDHQPPRKRPSRSRHTAADTAVAPAAFEETLTHLDEIVSQLEGGQLPLDQALSLYEEGVRLYHLCQTMLDTADLRLERLRIAASAPSDADDVEQFVEPFDLDER